MLQKASDLFFQRPMIFFGTLEAEEEMEEREFDLVWEMWPDQSMIQQQEIPLTGLFFHWAETIEENSIE